MTLIPHSWLHPYPLPYDFAVPFTEGVSYIFLSLDFRFSHITCSGQWRLNYSVSFPGLDLKSHCVFLHAFMYFYYCYEKNILESVLDPGGKWARYETELEQMSCPNWTLLYQSTTCLPTWKHVSPADFSRTIFQPRSANSQPNQTHVRRIHFYCYMALKCYDWILGCISVKIDH